MTQREEKLEDILKLRKPVYKKVKDFAAFCPLCKERLSGNSSLAFPWKCKCGEWKGDWISPGYYKINTNPQ